MGMKIYIFGILFHIIHADFLLKVPVRAQQITSTISQYNLAADCNKDLKIKDYNDTKKNQANELTRSQSVVTRDPAAITSAQSK